MNFPTITAPLKLSPDSKFSHLRRLVYDCLHPHLLGPKAAKAKEKDLLISLSQILREIQTWIRELDFDSDKETESEKKCYGESELHHEEHNCLIKVVTD